MKFQIREGFVCRTVESVDLGDGKTQAQEHVFYGGQKVDFSAADATDHAHKLEPLDKAAEAFLAAKVLPGAPGAVLGLSPEALALAQAMAGEMAKQIVAAIQTPAQAATA